VSPLSPPTSKSRYLIAPSNRETNPRDRISAIENEIGAGLIEEVIQVAEHEHELVNEMHKTKV
jgi:hypothetical protein